MGNKRISKVVLLVQEVRLVSNVLGLDRRAEYGIQRGIGGSQIRLHRFRGNCQAFAHVIEPVGRSVLRQHVLNARLNAEQIANGRFVLGSVKSSQHDVAACPIGPRQRGRECLDRRRLLRSGYSRLVLRRHFAFYHAIVDEHPSPGRFTVA